MLALGKTCLMKGRLKFNELLMKRYANKLEMIDGLDLMLKVTMFAGSTKRNIRVVS